MGNTVKVKIDTLDARKIIKEGLNEYGIDTLRLLVKSLNRENKLHSKHIKELDGVIEQYQELCNRLIEEKRTLLNVLEEEEE